MKKTLSHIILVSCFACPSFAQLKVNTNGNVAIQNASGTPLSPLSIGNNGNSDFTIYSTHDSRNGIFSQAKSNTIQWTLGGEMKSISDGMNFNVGLKGEAVTSNNLYKNKGRSFGVIGSAGNATQGWNYGVYGRLAGSANGAAVYGTTNITENGTQLFQRYAGYFNGDVGVNGDLTVNGNIDGVLLYESANLKQMETARGNSTTQENVPVKDMLTGISTISYYKDIPVKAQAIAEDTANVEVGKTDIELQKLSKKHYGISAEQLEEIFPDLVYTNTDGTKSINYMEMIPLLIQAINELNTKIAELETPGISKRTAPKTNETTGLDDITNDTGSLQQNVPNPFTGTTTIKMNIPASAKAAMLCVYDLNGKQIKQISIPNRGETSLSFSADMMSAGMYLYSLIIDSKLICTKRMVISD